MKFLKVRKRSIALMVVISLLVTLFPLALPAFAADYTRLGGVVSVNDESWTDLNTVKVETSPGELKVGDIVIVSLPGDFDFGGAYVSIPGDDTNNALVTDDLDVSYLKDNEMRIEVVSLFGDQMKDGLFHIYLEDVWVDEHDGDIPLKFKAPSGSGFDSGEVVVGRVTDGEVEIEVTDDETFGDDGGQVTIRMEEDRAGAFQDDYESVKFILPDGFEWDEEFSGGYGVDADLIFGDEDLPMNSEFYIIDDELVFEVDEGFATDEASMVEFTARIIIADEDDAKQGEIVAKVRGESDVTPDEIVVGVYGEYDFDVSADDPTIVYAGLVEQEIANVTIEETVEDSLIDGRSITLTLPDLYKWGSLPGIVGDEDDDCYLELVGFPGKDGQTAKYLVHNEDGGGAAELEFEDMEIIISPKAMPGELAITFGGTAGVKSDVKVADVTKPVVMTFTNVPTLAIGTQNQALAEITVTEVEAGLIKEGWPLVLILPPNIPWDSYEVEVTAGDLEIGDLDDMMDPPTKDEYLLIDIDDESTEASTIKVTASVDIDRSIPEGNVLVGLGGPAIVEVQNSYPGGALYDQYGSTVNGYYQIEGFDVVKQKGLFLNHNTVSGGVGAIIGTPAPGETKITAVFTLGSTSYLLNNIPQAMDVAPYAKNGRTYLPVRYVAKALGIPDSGIMWNKGTATFISGDRVVSVTIGSNVMYINGAAVVIDAAPEIANGRTMLPIRWIATAFGVNLSWDAVAQTVTVN